MVAQLDGWGEKWDVYRTYDRSWCVVRGDADQRRTFIRPALTEALSAAVGEGAPLPVVPRPPGRLTRDDITVVKSGSKWDVVDSRNGRSFIICGNLPTRKKAEAAADKIVEVHQMAVDRWDNDWAAVTAGVEGVDFRWAK